jgi:hypothetical protein
MIVFIKSGPDITVIKKNKGVKKMKTTDSVIVAYDYTNGVDKSLMLVGKKYLSKKDVEIIKVFNGTEAEELWKKLTCKEDK